jgi:transposase
MASAPQVQPGCSPTSATSAASPTATGSPPGTAAAPLDASSGAQQRHRLSRAGNRRINRTLHIMAVVQLRNRTEGRAYFDAKKAAGKTSMEAMRALKRRLSNLVYARMVQDHKRRQVAGPGGHTGTTLQSSMTDLTPDIGSSDKPLPEPTTTQPKPLVPTVP